MYDPLPIGGIAVALMTGTVALLDVPVDGPLLGAAFCGTALVYLADRTLGLSPEDRHNQPRRVAWVRAHGAWLRAEGIALGVGLLATVPLLEVKTAVAASGLGGVAALHVLTGVGRHRGGRGLDPVTVSLVWVGGAVLLPVVEAGEPVLSDGVLALAVYRMLLILPNVLVADWADREGDAAVGAGTWAVGWSRRGVQNGATGLLALAVAGAAGTVGVGAGPALLLLDALGGLLLMGGIWMLRPDRSPLHRLALDLVVAWPIVPWLVMVGSSG